jgi:hypothetical protein
MSLMRRLLWTALLVAGCSSDAAPLLLKPGESLQGHKNERVEVRGYVFDENVKGVSHLYEDPGRERYILISDHHVQERKALSGRYVSIVGKVWEVEPQPPGEPPKQMHAAGTLILGVESIREAPAPK